MLFIFTFCFFVESSLSNYDIQLDFSSTDYYLYLTENGIEIRTSLSKENANNLVYSNSNLINGTIILNISISPDQNSQHRLIIAKTTCTPFNLDVSIENLVPTINYFEITFYDSWACVTNVDITFHINQSYIHINNTPSNVNLQVQLLNNDQSIPSVFPKKLTNSSDQFQSFTRSVSFTELHTIPSQNETPSWNPTPGENLGEFPIVDFVSDSLLFDMNEEGFFEDDSKYLTTVNKSSTFINTITFTQQKITITETAEFVSISPLYFVAKNGESTVFLTENVTHSNIGVSSDNSPTVILSKSDHPLSFVNGNDHGSINIDLNYSPHSGVNTLNLNSLNNKVGIFTLTVPWEIKTVSFASIVLERMSSIQVSSGPEKSRIKDDDDDNFNVDDVTVDVRNLLNVTSLSEYVVFNTIYLIGVLFIFDDSSLVLNKPVFFSPLNSRLKIVFRNLDKFREKPILKFEKVLNSVPATIILANELNGELIEFSDLSFIEAKNFTSCELWRQKIGFENGRDGSIESRCEEIGNENVVALIVSARETVNKKEEDLSVGAIIGIVFGCIGAVLFVVLVAVFLSRIGHSSDISTEISSDKEDSIGL